ncbi:hypothetical protein IV203_038453 [Nitzschia inconspicua]|uniref:Uncharacterized protein n=1 Tax=Nitzschia inconspicua TaxID=303405 RepID=A0A9K3LNY6_9STRA|nr:hypothetical protein IV203_038447 [Nitzschia inconspicua]KAG7365250.1 hypothetical protein IV203_038453 [Nitzschia inconspicua]
MASPTAPTAATALIELLESTLKLYNGDKEKLVCIIVQPGLRAALDKVSTLMSKALNVKPSAQLRTLTLDAHQKILKAKKDNVIRWTSTMDMVRRYLRIKDELSACNGLEDYVLSGRENQVIKEAAKSFHTFNMITVEIQAKGMDLLHVWEQFVTLLSHEKVQNDGHVSRPESENRRKSKVQTSR